jgi:hypothetical protein
VVGLVALVPVVVGLVVERRHERGMALMFQDAHDFHIRVIIIIIIILHVRVCYKCDPSMREREGPSEYQPAMRIIKINQLLANRALSLRSS